MKEEIKKLIIEEYSKDDAQNVYMARAKDGLWDSELHFINKYFKERNSKVLDIGCGTGRTTISLVKMGYNVIGIDIVLKMIESAKKIAQEQKLNIDYRIGDATKLDFTDNSFDYVLFSNQGWTQIPGEEERLKALKEIYRTLKPGGIYIFTVHPRILFNRYFFLWIISWIRFYILKPVGFKIEEIDFGDRFFEPGAKSKRWVLNKPKYFFPVPTHIPAAKKVKKQIREAGFKIIKINGKLQVSEKNKRKHPPVFYVCRKY
jgi:ubiquinone/menaquinone biosynthesis C-methylase UbiE